MRPLNRKGRAISLFNPARPPPTRPQKSNTKEPNKWPPNPVSSVAPAERLARKNARKQNQQQQQQQQQTQPHAAAHEPDPSSAESNAAEPTESQSANPAPQEPRATGASEAQINANRRNAQFSTGAKSAATQAKSAQNHTIHGLARHDETNFKLLTTEDPEAFATLHKKLSDDHIPTCETEMILIRTMAESDWLSRRAQRLQDMFINPDTDLVTDERQFNLYKRYKTSHQREFHKCLSNLLKLRREKRAEQIGFEANRMKSELHEVQKIRADAEFSLKQIETQSKGVEFTLQYLRAKNENPGFDEAFSSFFAQRQAA